MDLFNSLLITFFGGVFPTFIWLYFWLQEDKKNPEPKSAILRTFLFGMLAVPIAAGGQFIWNNFFINHADIEFLFESHYLMAVITLVIWSAIEELLKYMAANSGGISRTDNNEPIDPIVYMITAALGFAALENMFYLYKMIIDNQPLKELFITGNVRFIGATMLHVASSAIVGIFMAFAYNKNSEVKSRYLVTGVVLSIILHTIFNSFIIRSGGSTLIGFAAVWLVALYIILMFERIKKSFNKIK